MNTFDYALVGFLVGLTATGAASAWILGRLKARLVAERLIDGNIEVLATLNKLRSGNIEAATKFLETMLNNSVVEMAKLVSRTRAGKLDQWLLFYISRAKDYRQKFPHQSKSDGADWRVAQAFSLVN